MQRDCEIMMTLELNFWLMLCSQEDLSFRNIYVSMLVGIKQLHTQKWFKKYRLETLVCDDIVKAREQRQILKNCKSISRRIFKCFKQFFFSYFSFGFRIWSKKSFTSAGLKNWRQASTNVATDHSWFFYMEILLRWSALVSSSNKVTRKAQYGGSDTYKNNCEIYFAYITLTINSVHMNKNKSLYSYWC